MHWFDELLSRVESFLGGKKDIVISAGLSVSGLQHVGRLRGEVILANAIANTLRKKGRDVNQLLVLYTQDSWKGTEGQLSRFENGRGDKYAGRKLIDVPDPFDCHKSWVDHYWEDFGNFLEKFANDVKVTSTTEIYLREDMQRNVLELMKKADHVRDMINKYRGRKKYPEGWIPFEPFCRECRTIGKAKALSFSENGRVRYRCSCGAEGDSRIEEGKLNWRVEWPSLWKILRVDIEPFGKDHAAPGGSRDSCKDIARNIMSFEPPFGIPYEWVGMSKQNKDLGDMSSSSFKGFTPKDWYEIGEPEALRYIYLHTNPSKRIVLDLAKMDIYHDNLDVGYRNYWHEGKDEPSELRSRTYELCMIDSIPRKDMFIIPYREAALLTQISPEDEKLTWVQLRLRDTGRLNRGLEADELEYLQKRLNLAAKWVRTHAPEIYKIKLLERLTSDVRNELTNDDVESLAIFREGLERSEWTETSLKEIMIQTSNKENFPVDKKRFFRNLYMVLLGREEGPRAAPFLSVLGKDFVLRRLEEVCR